MKRVARNDVKYEEISRASVTPTRNIVVSSCSKGGFTIAQQLVAKEHDGKDTVVYLKGAFHVDDVHGLYNLRDAINVAIHRVENEPDSQESWDE